MCVVCLWFGWGFVVYWWVWSCDVVCCWVGALIWLCLACSFGGLCVLVVVCFIGLMLFSLCWFWVSSLGFTLFCWVCLVSVGVCWVGLLFKIAVLCCCLFLV